jgi:hypothetical protein
LFIYEFYFIFANLCVSFLCNNLIAPHIAKGRSFFNKYARQKGFDPLIAQNWYTADREDIIAQKVSQKNIN